MPSQIIQFYRTPNLSASQRINPGQTLTINDAHATDNGEVFRRVVYMAVPRNSQATTIRLDNSLLSCHFDASTLTIGSQSNFLSKPWEYKENKIVAEFKRPWHIKNVVTSQTSFAQLYRVDGNAIADEATVSAASGSTINPEFISHHFALDYQQVSQIVLPMVVAENKSSNSNNNVSKKPSGNFVLALETENNFVFSQDIDLLGNSIVNIAEAALVSFHGVNSIKLNSYPTTPRILLPSQIANTEQPDHSDNLLNLQILWQQAGEIRDGINADLSTRLNEILGPLVTSAFSQPQDDPSIIWIPVVLESDVPCSWKLTALNVDFNYVINKFNNGKEKIILDFSSANITPQTLPITLPTGNIQQASFKIAISNKDGVNLPGTLQQQISAKGLTLNSDHWFAVKTMPASAGFYSAVAILCTLQTEELKIEASLIDAAATPTGTALVKTQSTVTRSGNQQWIILKFDVQRLDKVPYWFRLNILEGSSIWLCQTQSQDSTTINTENTGQQIAAITEIFTAPVETPLSAKQLSSSSQPVLKWMTNNNTVKTDSVLFTLLAENTALVLNTEGDQTFKLQSPSDINNIHSLNIQQVANGKLTISQPHIEFTAP